MSNWTKEQVKQILVDKGWYHSEREIRHAVQFILVDNTPIDCYNSGKVVVRGKATEIQKEADAVFSKSPTFSETPMPTANTSSDTHSPSTPKRVFIVYGHDKKAQDELELILHRLKLEPIVLEKIPSNGDTLIEKLEELTNADFACVLLTPDDKGHSVKEPDKIKFRARQSVVLEMGMVLAKLGRSRVAILIKGGELEKPSDIEGLIYIPFDEKIDKSRLAAELAKAGFNINPVDLA